jgi:hypothetical protein
MLPVGLVGSGAATAERSRWVKAFGLVVGVVVLDLVVIPACPSAGAVLYR